MTESFQDEIITLPLSIIKWKEYPHHPVGFCFCNAEDDGRRRQLARQRALSLVYAPRYLVQFGFPDARTERQCRTTVWSGAAGEYHYYRVTRRVTSWFAFCCLLPRTAQVWDYPDHQRTLQERTGYTRRASCRGCQSPNSYGGDVVFSSIINFKSKMVWCDGQRQSQDGQRRRLLRCALHRCGILLIDGNRGLRNLWTSRDEQSFVRLKVLGGFYCWMTNKADHRQNDAICFSAGLTRNSAISPLLPIWSDSGLWERRRPSAHLAQQSGSMNGRRTSSPSASIMAWRIFSFWHLFRRPDPSVLISALFLIPTITFQPLFWSTLLSSVAFPLFSYTLLSTSFSTFLATPTADYCFFPFFSYTLLPTTVFPLLCCTLLPTTAFSSSLLYCFDYCFFPFFVLSIECRFLHWKQNTAQSFMPFFYTNIKIRSCAVSTRRNMVSG